MDHSQSLDLLGNPSNSKWDRRANPKQFAESLDAEDPLRNLRSEFIIPSKDELKSERLFGQGLQPRRTSDRISAHLKAWSSKGVYGHFKSHKDSPLPPFLNVDEVAAEKMSKIVGALPSEVAVMGTLTANLHLLMASFYRPTKERWKIILEGKAFPSDHYAVESQIRHHNLNPADSMILIEPTSLDDATISTERICSVIDEHASTTALILLPGIQYYTGQYFDMAKITAHAHEREVLIGWDLAHAAGNVDVKLHDWNVDFAAWCNYKYVNSGPGAIGAIFVHERHGKVDMDKKDQGELGYTPRLSGWWGGDKSTRFRMENSTLFVLRSLPADHLTVFPAFVPIPGAAGFQVSNPSALDLSAVIASLEIFNMTSMSAIRQKSVHLTGWLEYLLQTKQSSGPDQEVLYNIITPSKPEERGGQLSVRLRAGLLDTVMKELEENGVVVDERKPDVVRVAPAPLYNTFVEVWEFAQIFCKACEVAAHGKGTDGRGSLMVEGGRDRPAWSEIK
ncbi:MAG: Kynureninase (L-kynurenine hydrolase) [Candelina submexicana]|nr:MAG: Kynureninase (L-kynurenine hydrolase) [Candelina submexicana]